MWEWAPAEMHQFDPGVHSLLGLQRSSSSLFGSSFCRALTEHFWPKKQPKGGWGRTEHVGGEGTSVVVRSEAETFCSLKLASAARCGSPLAPVAARSAVIGAELRGEEAPNSWELWPVHQLEAAGSAADGAPAPMVGFPAGMLTVANSWGWADRREIIVEIRIQLVDVG